MSKNLAIIVVLVLCCSCSDRALVENSNDRLENMRTTFRTLVLSNIDFYQKMSLWNNFLIAFKDDIDGEEDDQIRQRVLQRIKVMRNKLRRKRESSKIVIQSDLKKSNSLQNGQKVWVKKHDEKYKANYQVKSNWQLQHFSNTNDEQAYRYILNSHQYIVFNFYDYGPTLGLNQIILQAQDRIFSNGYSDYTITRTQNMDLNGILGRYIAYRLVDKKGNNYLAKVFYRFYQGKVYLCYSVSPYSSKRHLAEINKSTTSLTIQKDLVIPHGKKWKYIHFPLLRYAYKIPNSWKSLSVMSDSNANISMYYPGKMGIIYVSLLKRKISNWQKVLKPSLKWIEPYELISQQRKNINGIPARKNIYKTRIPSLPFAPHLMEALYGSKGNHSFLIYVGYPSMQDKKETTYLHSTMASINILPPRTAIKKFKTIYEEKFPISYSIPDRFKKHSEEDSLDVVHNIYESDDIQMSFYFSRIHKNLSLESIIGSVEKSLSLLPNLTKKHEKKVMRGKKKFYSCFTKEEGKYKAKYLFVTNKNFSCVIGYWTRLNRFPGLFKKICDSIEFKLGDKEKQKHYAEVLKNNKSSVAFYNMSSIPGNKTLKLLSKAIKRNFIFPEAFLAKANVLRSHKKHKRAAQDYQIFLLQKRYTSQNVVIPKDINLYVKEHLPQIPNTTPLFEVYDAISKNQWRFNICKLKKLRQKFITTKKWKMLDVTYQYISKDNQENGQDRRIFFADNSNKVHEIESSGLSLENKIDMTNTNKFYLKKAIRNYYNNIGPYSESYTMNKIDKIRMKELTVQELDIKWTYIPAKSNHFDDVQALDRFVVVPLLKKCYVFKIKRNY
ncbi:hypothetical protein [Candidatus Uabimicrobium sp. HlEnr_7]|uniref:hypothetical protein n=1 Tax=Candidatus Uabimicrobium helgolandensis TaxID=3095367 RepID=UPI0035577D91